MNKHEFTALENEMINFNYDDLQRFADETRAQLTGAKSAADVSSRICELWSKIGRFIRPLASLPFVGKFVKLLVDVLDSLCPR